MVDSLRVELIVTTGKGSEPLFNDQDVYTGEEPYDLTMLDVNVLINGIPLSGCIDLPVLLSLTESTKDYLLTCSCGVPECAGIWAPVVIDVTDSEVSWTFPAEQYTSPNALPQRTVTFEKAAYLETLQQLKDQVRQAVDESPWDIIKLPAWEEITKQFRHGSHPLDSMLSIIYTAHARARLLAPIEDMLIGARWASGECQSMYGEYFVDALAPASRAGVVQVIKEVESGDRKAMDTLKHIINKSKKFKGTPLIDGSLAQDYSAPRRTPEGDVQEVWVFKYEGPTE